MSRRTKLLLGLATVILAGLTVLFSLPSIVDRRMNGIAAKPPYTATEQALVLHQTLFAADLHGDTLLWNRDLQSLHGYGHIDLPRLKQGHVALQVFAAVTKTPRGQNFDRTSSDTDKLENVDKLYDAGFRMAGLTHFFDNELAALPME